jgi:pilus assembly protein Flp/PilA
MADRKMPTPPLPDRRRKGVTAIEYGMIAGGIALLIVSALVLIGTDIASTFEILANRLADSLL